MFNNNWFYSGEEDNNNFSPTTITNLFAWWSADTGLTLSGSNRVTSWVDQINSHTLLSSGTLAPTYSASHTSFNNRSVVAFNGANKLISNESAATWRFLSNTSGSTVCFVARATDPTLTTVFSTHPATANNGYLFVLGYTGDTYATVLRNTSTATAYTIDVHPVTGSTIWYCVGVTSGALKTRGSQRPYSNNNIVLSQTGSTPGSTLIVGATDAASWELTGQIGEIIVYNKLLSEAEMQQMGTYFTLKYSAVE